MAAEIIVAKHGVGMSAKIISEKPVCYSVDIFLTISVYGSNEAAAK